MECRGPILLVAPPTLSLCVRLLTQFSSDSDQTGDLLHERQRRQLLLLHHCQRRNRIGTERLVLGQQQIFLLLIDAVDLRDRFFNG